MVEHERVVMGEAFRTARLFTTLEGVRFVHVGTEADHLVLHPWQPVPQFAPAGVPEGPKLPERTTCMLSG